MDDQMTSNIKNEASQMSEQAARSAKKAASSMNSVMRDRLDSSRHKASDRLSGAVDNLRQVADTLDQQGQPGASKLVNSATRQAERVTDYMDHTSADQMLSDASRYAKDHLWVVLAGGLVLGTVAARFLKAAMTEPEEMQATRPMVTAEPVTSYPRAA